jgi:hypothetical protein
MIAPTPRLPGSGTPAGLALPPLRLTKSYDAVPARPGNANRWNATSQGMFCTICTRLAAEWVPLSTMGMFPMSCARRAATAPPSTNGLFSMCCTRLRAARALPTNVSATATPPARLTETSATTQLLNLADASTRRDTYSGSSTAGSCDPARAASISPGAVPAAWNRTRPTSQGRVIFKPTTGSRILSDMTFIVLDRSDQRDRGDSRAARL